MAWKAIKPNRESAEQFVETTKKAVEETPPSIQKKAVLKDITHVVWKLPTQEIRKYTDEDGTIVNLITVEEFLTEQANAGAE